MALLDLNDLILELAELKQEYDNYRIITESAIDNKKVKDIRRHISWYDREELKEKAKQVTDEEQLSKCLENSRRQERLKRRREERRRQRREERRRRQRREERRRQRKALDKLMEKERRERARKNTEN